MPATYPEEAKNFRLIGHDPSAAWGGGSLVQVHKGHAYVGAVGGSSYNGPEGFTVHDVRDPKKPKKVGEFRAPPGIHCHKLRIVGDDLLYVNSERLPGDRTGRDAAPPRPDSGAAQSSGADPGSAVAGAAPAPDQRNSGHDKQGSPPTPGGTSFRRGWATLPAPV